MDINKLSGSIETTMQSTDILKPISEITTIISNEYLKKLELDEYCKIIQSELSKFQKRVQTLASAKNESAKVKAEYKSRNKINITNSKSLRQALNELYKYKAELKSCYIATEKASKSRKIKYKNIISAYDSSWKEALKEYSADPVFMELLEIQQENTLLEREIERQEKLRACAETEFVQIKKNIEKEFTEKTVEFSKAVIRYKGLLNSQNPFKKDELLKFQNSEGSFEFRLFRADVQSSGKSSFDSNDDTNVICTVDMSVFDNITVPSENLESQNLEDDGYSFMQNDGKQLSDISKDQDEDLEYLRDYQQRAESLNKEATNSKGNSVQEHLKSANVEEDESQYFKQQALESQVENLQPSDGRNLVEESFNKQKHTKGKFDNNLDGDGRRLNSGKNESTFSVRQMENDYATEMECEESVNEGSYEKRFGDQKENYEFQYRKTPSVSSDDIISNGDNQNEIAAPSSYKPCEEEQGDCLKPRCEEEKNNFKFAGFFTMGNDHETSTPSIFKLF